MESARPIRAVKGAVLNTFAEVTYAEATETFALAAELSPNDPDLRTNLALTLQKAGHSDEAKKAFAEARRLRNAAAPKDAVVN